MRILIVDDERSARAALRLLLAVHSVDVVGEADRVADALVLADTLRPDLVFLDVRMCGETGFDFFDGVGRPAPPVVLVTAHDGFALRGFECNVLDYLLKPVRPERLAESLRRARRGPPASVPTGVYGRGSAFTVIKIAGASRVVAWVDIGCVQAEGNYTRVSLRGCSPCLVLRPLKQWLADAPPGALVRAHRGALVRVDWIREIRANRQGDRELLLIGGASVAVGRAFWPGLNRLLCGGDSRSHLGRSSRAAD